MGECFKTLASSAQSGRLVCFLVLKDGLGSFLSGFTGNGLLRRIKPGSIVRHIVAAVLLMAGRERSRWIQNGPRPVCSVAGHPRLVGHVELGTDSWISNMTEAILASPSKGMLLFVLHFGVDVHPALLRGLIVHKTRPDWSAFWLSAPPCDALDCPSSAA